MIPPFDDNGYLPPGIYSATLDEIEARFGAVTEIRQVQMESVRWLGDLARRAGVYRIILNGSFVTAKMEPQDVDCVLLVGADFPVDASAGEALDAGLPFLELKLVEAVEFGEYVTDVYATDRQGVAKGMIEVIL